jgi:hypothetical protein
MSTDEKEIGEYMNLARESKGEGFGGIRDEFLCNHLVVNFLVFCQLVWNPLGCDLSLTQSLCQNPENRDG